MSRKAVAGVAIALAPLMAAVAFSGLSEVARWLALAWGVLAVTVAWAAGRKLSRRITALTSFAGELPGTAQNRPRLPLEDDEMGDLARALSRSAPKVEAALQGLTTELARREAILSSMTEAVLAVDARLRISFCNDAFVRLAAHPVAEGVPLINVFRDPGLFQLLEQVVDSGETVRRRLNVSAQEDRWFDAYASPLDGPEARGVLAILHDVTPMERLERAQRDFVANVSHEFRTPLATITGCAETLLNNAPGEADRRRFLEIIQANSARLTHIAADLITLSQVDSGRSRAEATPIAVEEVVSSAIRAIEPVAAMHQVTVQASEICASLVLGHRIALEQALLNLLDNAVKFNRSAGQVTVCAAFGADDVVEISVSDTGIGIPEEDLSRIFERFYRVDKARSRQIGGTGLGLSIVRNAVERMQGGVRVESQLGKGSRFTLVLPRYVGEATS